MKSPHRTLVSLALAIAMGNPALPKSRTSQAIPFRYGGAFGVMLIQAEVNGTRTTFIVDTGSNRTIVSSKFAGVDANMVGMSVEAEKGSGFVGRGMYRVMSLRVGSVTWKEREIVVMDLEGISKSIGEEVGGLLGMDFLEGFKVVVVDLHRHQLVLTQ